MFFKMTACGDPGQVTNAVRTGPSSFTVGSTATYSCNQDFQLVGNGQITCQTNGAWTARPACTRPTDSKY